MLFLKRLSLSCRKPLGGKISSPGGGYILFEVLLAMAIFAFAGIGLIASLGHTADSMLSSNRESQIRLALHSHLAESLALPIELSVKSDPSDDPTVSYEHEWIPLKEVTTNNLQLPNLYTLIVRAKWTQQGTPRTQQAKIVVYHPQP